MDRLADYDYSLPDELIAREPLAERSASRMLVVDRAKQEIQHCQVTDLPDFLNTGDAVVLNDTRVLPARLTGYRTETGGRWEGLFLDVDEDGTWQIIGQTRGRLQKGETITLTPFHQEKDSSADGVKLEILEDLPDGIRRVLPSSTESAEDILSRLGTLPLPPYIGRDKAAADDWSRYQTVFARKPGAVAAPTAGLHLTDTLLSTIRDRGVSTHFVTLHVGIGTFRPVKVQNLGEHRMHQEWCEIESETAQRLSETRSNGGRILAVGTTTVRTLETAARSGRLSPFCGQTDLFLRPGSAFHCVDLLLTNFHLPKSTLLMLVSAFAGYDLIRQAYQEAVQEKYRFFSYGDAMLIL